ncbi:MAG TPA: HEAT repeat domain-containing protein [Candidatus Wallbacteria bacterium]|nr:HEAT repeat domain-containing protein [Candidatus Wallbacteria bacterium]
MTEKRIPKKIIYLNVTGFFLKFATTVSLILSCTSFLKTAGAETLPLYYIILNILSISAGTTLAVKNIRDFRAPVYLSAVIGVYLAWFSSVMESAGYAGVIVLYTLTSLYDIYANILFWTHINQCLTIKEMKSYVGLISGVSFFGGILAGLFTKFLLGYISMKSAFIMCAAAHLLLPLVTLLHVESPYEGGSFLRSGFLDTARREISASKLLKIIMMIFVFSSFVRYIVGFQYGTAAAARFTDEKSLAGFIGLFDSAVKISIFISQILAAKKLLKNFSLSANLLFYQFGIIALSLTLFFMKSFWVMIVFQFYFQLFVKLIEQNVANTLFNVFARDIKNQMKFMVEGMVFPLTSIFVGVFIACFKDSIEPRYFFLFLSIAGICYYISTLKLNEAYMDTIAGELRNGASSGKAGITVEKTPMDANFDIEYYLASERPGRLDMVLELEKLSPVISSGIILKLLRGEKDKIVMASIVKTACRQKSDEVRNELWRTVSDTNDNRVTANFIEASAMQGDSRLIPYISPYLQHPNNRVRANAILAAVKLCGEESCLRLAVESLYKMALSADSGYRASAAAVMGELGLECFSGALEKLLFDEEFHVRKSALSACEKNGSQKLIPALEKMKSLAENEKIAAFAERAIAGIENGVFSKISMVLNAYPNDEKRRIAALLKKAGDNASADILIKILNTSPGGFSLKFAEIFSASSRGKELLQLAEDYIRDKKFPVRDLLNAVIFEEKKYERGDELLKAVSSLHRSIFEEEFAAVLKSGTSYGSAFARASFRALGVYLNDSERAMAIFENAGSKDQAKADMALELLESIEYAPLKECFIEICRSLKA